MMLTTKGRYATMAIADLALYSKYDQTINKHKPVSLLQIAERQEITLAYLEQLFAKLKKHAIVSSVRGPGGGYILNKEPNDITIYELVSAVEEQLKITRCKDHKDSGCMSSNGKCLTHDLWHGLGDVIKQYLSSVTVYDVVYGEKKVIDFLGQDIASDIKNRKAAANI